MIEWAAERCEQLVVMVNTREGEAAPGELRAAWLQRLHPYVTVVHNAHDLDNDWNDEDLWRRWIELIRSLWPFSGDEGAGPEVVVSSDFYIAELARRLGAEALVCDPERVNVPISATLIRNDPGAHLVRLAPEVRAWVEQNWL